MRVGRMVFVDLAGVEPRFETWKIEHTDGDAYLMCAEPRRTARRLLLLLVLYARTAVARRLDRWAEQRVYGQPE